MNCKQKIHNLLVSEMQDPTSVEALCTRSCMIFDIYYRLVKLYNTGIIRRRNLTESILKREMIKKNKPLTLPQVSAVLSIIPMGIFISLIFLVIEVMVHKRKR